MGFRFILLTLISGLATAEAAAGNAKPIVNEECRLVRFSDLGDPDLVIKTAAVAVVFEALGYTPQTQAFSQKQTFSALDKGEIDIFLGADRATMAKDISLARKRGSVETFGVNQVPAPKNQPKTPDTARLGPPATVSAVPGLEDNDAPGDFVLAGRQSAMSPASGNRKGSDENSPAEILGIETLARSGFAQACPNASRLIGNLVFTSEMTTFITARVETEYEALFDGAVAWFDLNREALEAWLAGVNTINGTDAMDAVAQEFFLN